MPSRGPVCAELLVGAGAGEDFVGGVRAEEFFVSRQAKGMFSGRENFRTVVVVVVVAEPDSTCERFTPRQRRERRKKITWNKLTTARPT